MLLRSSDLELFLQCESDILSLYREKCPEAAQAYEAARARADEALDAVQKAAAGGEPREAHAWAKKGAELLPVAMFDWAVQRNIYARWIEKKTGPLLKVKGKTQ